MEPRPARAGSDPAGEYDRVLAENRRYVEAFDRSALTAAPLSGLAIVACMDARLDVEEALGLRTGDAHIIRNAGGLVTDDVIRSLIVSQQLLGTREIVVIEHTQCGLHGANEDAIRTMVPSPPGESPVITFGAFDDLESNLRTQVGLLRNHPWLKVVRVHGLIFDVETGRLHPVE